MSTPGVGVGWVGEPVAADTIRAGDVLELDGEGGRFLAMVQWASMYPGHDAPPGHVTLIVQYGIYAATRWSPRADELVTVLRRRDVLAGEVIAGR